MFWNIKACSEFSFLHKSLTKGLTTDTIRDGGIIPLYAVYTCYTTLVPPLTLFTLFQQFEEKKGSYTWTYDMAI